eukprot:CAMPEP_0201508836 /NCGR_PEP_ID=MMETSP0161_2-20130828/2045_1 /ASSEMBLY_ACC=CAM_ASM_000251 /TAXON_ID=180227 /ORGANISM="Neoparamoeba aestuarina, Strain SoJaBio B1-5/56/2" /LENGTH=462 /DNA_ID=CAMNT_0047903609 /DNA_START=236 /DNA_END=1627 /DNA_ORIENTATION=-
MEGQAGVEDAINFLKQVSPVPGLQTLSPGLCRSCQDLCADAGSMGSVGNVLSDGTVLEARIQRYGNWGGSLTECTAYGATTPLNSVLQWLIDDGNPNRTHRHSIMNPCYAVAGVAEGPHCIYKSMVVMDLATTYIEAIPSFSASPSASPSQSMSCYSNYSPSSFNVTVGGGGAQAVHNQSVYAGQNPANPGLSNMNSYQGQGLGFNSQSIRNPQFDLSTGSTCDFDAKSNSSPIRSQGSQTSPNVDTPIPEPTSVNCEVQSAMMNIEKGKMKIEAVSLPGPPILREMQLKLHGHRLVLTIQSSSKSQFIKSWEFHFTPNPSDIVANYRGATLTIFVTLPTPPSDAKAFKFGNFIIQGSTSGRDRVLIGAHQLKGILVLTCIPSRYETSIMCECHGTQITVNSAHKEKRDGETVEIHTKRVIPLPFLATPNQFQIIQGYRIKISYPAPPPPSKTAPVAIPIIG